MELTGNLSDFALSDILQIMSLSKKTGTLSLTAEGVEGRIVIERGRIIHATISPGQNFGEYLMNADLLSASDYNDLKAACSQSPKPWTLGPLIVEKGLLSGEDFEFYARRFLWTVLRDLIQLEKANFGIVLNEISSLGEFGEVKLRDGFEVGEVLLGEAKERDEAGRDDLPIFSTLEAQLQKKQSSVLSNFPLFNDDPFVRKTKELMYPSSYEMSALKSNGQAFPDRFTSLAENDYLNNLNEDSRYRYEGNQFTGSTTSMQAMKDKPQLLCSLLAELRALSFEAEVSLSVMRYASEVASRGILFVVKNEELCGLGQFGVNKGNYDGSLDDMVRAIRIPIKVQSIFTNVVTTGSAYIGKLKDGYWNLEVLNRLGETNQELKAFALPLFCRGRVMFVVYGDNYPGNREFEGFDEFQVFVQQATMALDKLVLERELHDMQPLLAS